MWYRPRGSLGGFLLLMSIISYRAVLQSNQGRNLSSSGERSAKLGPDPAASAYA
jgi:hypothetical protein